MLTFSCKRANREHLKLMSYLRPILEAEDKMLRASESVGDVQEDVPVSRIATSLASGSQLLQVSEPTGVCCCNLLCCLLLIRREKGLQTAERFGFILRKAEDCSWRKVCTRRRGYWEPERGTGWGRAQTLLACSFVPPMVRIVAHLVLFSFPLQKHDV